MRSGHGHCGLSSPQILFCKLISKLNKMPRYGRYYVIANGEIQKPKWHYRKFGFWGLNILDNMNLLDKYLNHMEDCQSG